MMAEIEAKVKAVIGIGPEAGTAELAEVAGDD